MTGKDDGNSFCGSGKHIMMSALASQPPAEEEENKF